MSPTKRGVYNLNLKNHTSKTVRKNIYLPVLYAKNISKEPAWLKRKRLEH